MLGIDLLSQLSVYQRKRNGQAAVLPESNGILDYLSNLVGTAATFVGIRTHTPEIHGDDELKELLRPTSAVLGRGRRLGPYHLLRRLGRGAQGEVWKALQLTPTIRLVAIKVMNSSLRENPVRLAQFYREAARGAKLSGPSLLRIYESGEIDGHIFMAMPYVEGISLKEIIAARTSYEEGERAYVSHPVVTADDETYIRFIVHALAKATRALAIVHENRVVHRDVKPANILLDNNRTDQVYLCDFGLGRELDVATPEQMRDGSGTPMFMAPERLLRATADEMKCDIYSMGVTLFEALTCKRPFQVPENSSWPMLANFLATSDPSTPSQVRPGFPRELEEIIVRAMSRDPAKRHNSAAELADELTEFQSRWNPSRRNPRYHAPHPVYRPHFHRYQDA